MLMVECALITGGAVRIGRAISLRLAQGGFAVAIHYHRSRCEAEKVADEISAAGGTAACFEADLASHAEVERLTPAVNRAMGPIGCLINNASTFADDRLTSLSVTNFRAHMAVNLEAPLFLSQAFAAQLPEEETGSIVNILDQRVLRPNPLFFSYTLSKCALWTATRTMAQALAPRIRVNAVGPGPTLGNPYQSEADFARERRAMPLGDGALPEEIAQAVFYLVRARSVTGQMLALDGGQHLLWQTPDIGAT